jgi:spermidine synthase
LAKFSKGGDIFAVEPCEEIRDAAEKWFGVTPTCGFEMVTAFGEPFLQSLPANTLDVLIIDADDGTVPPTSMQTIDFWGSIVLPVLSEDAVVGVNVIGDKDERDSLEETLSAVFPKHAVMQIQAPLEAEVDVERHSLIFVSPFAVDPDELEAQLTERPVIDNPHAWIREFRK